MIKCSIKCSYGGKSVSLLSWTSDMEAWSFSLPAGDSCPMMRADDPSYICHGCYAKINRYNMPNVLDAQWIRFMWVKSLMSSHAGRGEFVTTMVDAIRKYATNGYFRCHDSGDFFHPSYARSWYYVCKELPHIQFWFPTRNYPHNGKMSQRWVDSLTRLASLPNVTIRPSALRWNDAPPEVPWLSSGTTVVDKPEKATQLGCSLCPKTVNGGTCESNECRTCWYTGTEVAYLVHGYRGRKVAPNAMSVKIQSLRDGYKDKYQKLTVKGKIHAGSIR